MSPELLLEHFHKMVDAPDAVAHLRTFILDLAVSGKLVLQNPEDEPATELLERIKARKQQLIQSGQAKQGRLPDEKIRPPSNDGIPTTWQWSNLAAIGFISPRNQAPDDTEASFVPMPFIETKYGIKHQTETRAWKDIKSGYTHFAEGDVTLAKITPCFENGKSAVMCDLTNGIGAGTTELHVVRPIFVNPDYVLVFLKSRSFVARGIPMMTGTAGQKRVPTEYFALSAFPLPPIEEQQRIVAKVGELMALCDELEATQEQREDRRDTLNIASLSRITTESDSFIFKNHVRFHLDNFETFTHRPDQIPALRQTILNLAVRGKLVHQDPTDEPALVPSPEKEQNPYTLPRNWVWSSFPMLGVFGRGKSKHRPRNDPALFENGTHPFVQTGDVARARGLIRSYSALYSDFGLAQSLKWPKGTLCITIAANIADSSILDFDACFPDSVVGFIPDPLFPNARYFEYFMRTAKADLSTYAPATAQKNINLGILSELRIPIPPLREMDRIVARIDELMALCDELEALLTRKQIISSKAVATLMQPKTEEV